jgi:hypothetical protein
MRPPWGKNDGPSRFHSAGAGQREVRPRGTQRLRSSRGKLHEASDRGTHRVDHLRRYPTPKFLLADGRIFGMAKTPDRELLALLASYDPHIARLALAAREMVLEEAPGALESYAKSYAVSIMFSFTGKPLKDGFCHVVA